MSPPAALDSELFDWDATNLRRAPWRNPATAGVAAADSWFVDAGSALGLELHRERFATATAPHGVSIDDFWSSVIAVIPPAGAWFPRVDLEIGAGSPRLSFRLRPAPARTRSARVISHHGVDPRTSPTVKGPDLAAMAILRATARERAADDAVILSPDGFVVEGAYSAMLWWRGDTLCLPSPDLARVDSVTARSIVTLAMALGTDVYPESVRPDELAATEVWSVNALHGIRIVTEWIDGPPMAELPGRWATWRTRLGRLSRPIVSLDS